MRNNRLITISLPKSQIEKSKRLAKNTGRTFSGLIDYALNKIIGDKNG